MSSTRETPAMTNRNPNLGFLVHEVAHLLRRRFEQRSGHQGLTRSQWRAIAYLARQEGVHQAHLAERLEIEPITLVRILDRLEGRGLVERRQDPNDRRAWLLYLKDAARPLLVGMQAIGDASRAEALEGVSEADIERLVETLGRMKSNLAAACQTPVDTREPQYG
jgi:MarR family transcriptional regulator, transcriptional regulator for hemolysin